MTDTRTPAVAFESVTCRFPGEKGQPDYTATENVSFAIHQGEFVSIVGPTGCGKSTLMQTAAGLLRPASGRVAVFGETLNGINRRAGVCFQGESLMPWATALENVALGLELKGIPRREAHARAMQWLARVGLQHFEHRYSHELSGGMRKRVAIAQMFITNPDILLMDESFSALDVQTRQLMETELLELWQSDGRKAVLFITHDLEEAVSMSDRVVILSAGPASHPIGDFRIDLPRPRSVAEIRTTPEFLAHYDAIWSVLRSEVMKSYRQSFAA